jgi:PKD repeat protein
VASVLVKNRAPIAVLTEMPSIINANEEVSFDASSSFDNDGTVVSYIWSFGDKTAASGGTVTHSYANTGVYNVTLTVLDNDGAADSRVQPIQVKNGDNNPPVASIIVNVNTADINEILSFDGSDSYDSDGTIVSYSWDFGDGTTATEAETDHQYNQGGAYTVKLTVIDDDGAIDSATGLITVTNNVVNSPPVAAFNENATKVISEETIYFDASESYDDDGTVVSYAWDFGDAKTATGVTVEHAYSESGIYITTLTVTDNDGGSSSAVAEITVETETILSLAILSGIGIGITALTAALLFAFLKRINKKKQSNR